MSNQRTTIDRTNCEHTSSDLDVPDWMAISFQGGMVKSHRVSGYTLGTLRTSDDTHAGLLVCGNQLAGFAFHCALDAPALRALAAAALHVADTLDGGKGKQ